MKAKSTKIFITASMTLFLIITGIGLSYAWYKSDAVVENVPSAMGKVEVAVTYETEVTASGNLSFTVTNGSNIDTYMRLGWTPVYKKDGKELTKDTQSIRVSTVSVNGLLPDGSSFAPVPVAAAIESLNEYKKEIIIFEDGSSNYFVVPANGSISGTITVTGAASKNGESLHLILVPEAIQATQKAVAAASGYGWDTDMVGEQASTIVPEGGGA